MKELEHQANILPTLQRALMLGLSCHVPAEKLNDTRSGGVDSSRQVEEGGFPTSAPPRNGDSHALLDRDIDPLESPQLGPARLRIDFVHIPEDENR